MGELVGWNTPKAEGEFPPAFDLTPYREKRCCKCKKYLPIEEFSMRERGAYYRTECRKCTKVLIRERKALREKHGNPVPPSDHHCPICGKSEKEVSYDGGSRQTPWAFDHDHVTNRFRGWLCHKCNRSLGSFDTVEILKNAIAYLERPAPEREQSGFERITP